MKPSGGKFGPGNLEWGKFEIGSGAGAAGETDGYIPLLNEPGRRQKEGIVNKIWLA